MCSPFSWLEDAFLLSFAASCIWVYFAYTSKNTRNNSISVQLEPQNSVKISEYQCWKKVSLILRKHHCQLGRAVKKPENLKIVWISYLDVMTTDFLRQLKSILENTSFLRGHVHPRGWWGTRVGGNRASAVLWVQGQEPRRQDGQGGDDGLDSSIRLWPRWSRSQTPPAPVRCQPGAPLSSAVLNSCLSEDRFPPLTNCAFCSHSGWKTEQTGDPGQLWGVCGQSGNWLWWGFTSTWWVLDWIKIVVYKIIYSNINQSSRQVLSFKFIPSNWFVVSSCLLNSPSPES